VGSLALVLGACLAGPPLVVGLAALGVPWRLSTALIAAAGIVVVWRTGAQARAIGYHRLNWPALVAALTVLGAATVYTSRLSVFMLDETRVDLSVVPNRAFFRTHSCLSSYIEAARLAPAGVNIFDPSQYSDPAPPGEIKPRFIGSFEVDLYQYPPAFLALPRPAVAAGLDFLTIRRLWFAVQSVVLFMAVALVARWIGGPSGLLALLLAPVLWLAVTTRLGLQIGNFQLTAFAMAVLAMIAFDRGHAARGGFALGFPAVSKVYPGVLGVLLLVDRRWSAVAWTLAWGLAFTAAAWFMVGSVPFWDFFRYQLPRVASAQAFPWIENSDAAAINYGVHGLVIKLRFLGLPWTGPVAASRAASLYGVLLLPIALGSAWQLRRLAAGPMNAERLRLRTAQVWIGLLSLASFRSPFVPDAYALIGTLWLLTLIAAEGHWQAPGRIALVIGGAITMLVLDGGAIPIPVPAWIMAATLALQVAAFALNLAVVLTPGREPISSLGQRRPAASIMMAQGSGLRQKHREHTR
jgi:alpha-1,2-mannosyltransferase